MKRTNFGNKELYCLKIIFLIVLFSSCKLEILKEELNEEYYLTNEQKKLIPYIGNENLVFISNNGDTIVYTGKGCNDKIEKVVVVKNKLYDLMETKSCKFFNDKDSSYLDFNIGATENFDYEFGISFYEENEFNTKIFLTIFSVDYILKKDTSQLKRDTLFFSSLKIGNINYKNVYKINNKYQPQKSKINMVSLYYTLLNGVVEINFDNSENWILKNK